MAGELLQARGPESVDAAYGIGVLRVLTSLVLARLAPYEFDTISCAKDTELFAEG